MKTKLLKKLRKEASINIRLDFLQDLKCLQLVKYQVIQYDRRPFVVLGSSIFLDEAVSILKDSRRKYILGKVGEIRLDKLLKQLKHR